MAIQLFKRKLFSRINGDGYVISAFLPMEKYTYVQVMEIIMMYWLKSPVCNHVEYLRHKFFSVSLKQSYMKRKEKNKAGPSKKGHHEYPLPGEITPQQKELNINARKEADKDMTEDVDFTAQSKNDDLDEGESARLGEEHTDLV